MYIEVGSKREWKRERGVYHDLDKIRYCSVVAASYTGLTVRISLVQSVSSDHSAQLLCSTNMKKER
jgi:hypothetical protein